MTKKLFFVIAFVTCATPAFAFNPQPDPPGRTASQVGTPATTQTNTTTTAHVQTCDGSVRK